MALKKYGNDVGKLADDFIEKGSGVDVDELLPFYADDAELRMKLPDGTVVKAKGKKELKVMLEQQLEIRGGKAVFVSKDRKIEENRVKEVWECTSPRHPKVLGFNEFVIGDEGNVSSHELTMTEIPPAGDD